jgi:monoterpene epsilon-lactone hydrolase
MLEVGLQGKDPREHSPLLAELKGLPPLLIQARTAEAIFDDGRRFSAQASVAGVEVTFEPWEDRIHLWHGFPCLPEAQQAVERIAGYLGEHLQSRD